MEWDLKIRITDIIMIFAIVIGPVIAVQITEYLRRSKENRDRKIHIFRSLMGTRSSQLVPIHIEALNLVEMEFSQSNNQEKNVLDSWSLYVSHLRDHHYPEETWGARRHELQVDMLYEMSVALGYSFDKVQIKSGSYYPALYEDKERDEKEIRESFLKILKGEKPFPIIAGVYDLPPSKNKDKKTENN